MDENELYKRLGVKRNASAAAIKKAFRRKAKEMHPDHGGDPEAFKKVVEAYEVLTDPLKRARYNSGKDYTEDYQRNLINYILGIFTDFVTSDRISEGLNIIELLRHKIKQDQNEARQVIKNIEDRKKELRRYAGTIRKKSEGPNIFQEFIDQKQIELDVAIAENKKKIEFFGEAAEILDVYEFHGDTPDLFNALFGPSGRTQQTGNGYTHTFRFSTGV